MFYAVYADGELDQICDTKPQAEKEKRDLTKMGCAVRIKKITDERDVYDLANR